MSIVRIGCVAVFASAAFGGMAAAETDLVVSNMSQVRKWGTSAGITGYTFAHDYCNIGDQPADVFQASPLHPVITASLYRLSGGRLEQIGQGFGFHEYCVLQGTQCGPCSAVPTACVALGAGCSTNTSSINAGIQGRLASRRHIDPKTGVFGWPLSGLADEGDALFKRVQVANADLDPALNSGAVYFVESRILEQADGLGGNGLNNATCKAVAVGALDAGGYLLSTSGSVQQVSAVQRWGTLDAGVQVSLIDFGDGERFVLGSKTADNGDGTWTYEYALENYSSTQGAGSFRVALGGATASAPGFHDVAYHSGEPIDGTDWGATIIGTSSIEWMTVQTWNQNPDANAVRWGTTYNFRFVANTGPQQGTATIGLFAPGAQASVDGAALVPSAVPACQGDADGDGDVDFGDITSVLASWGSGGPIGDADHDGDVEFSDVTVVLALFGSAC